eukprot:CAMPEP_0184703868 /NCGR_PEP_ID=MMETSP0313-20130426/29340_1 /TAXON_ID=2792 /ORGANISM="Porphyridium aerugineum, Strain SAG 1380-2" /LENGTH=46 /DNA_ID= /DNA_START= /DNA_END= /DNA_ORIENTATION=
MGRCVDAIRGCKVFQHAIGADPMFHTELFPKLGTDLVAALAHLQRY